MKIISREPVVPSKGHIPPPDVCVLVATLRALKLLGGVELEKVNEENLAAVEQGFKNIKKHTENIESIRGVLHRNRRKDKKKDTQVKTRYAHNFYEIP